MKLRHIALRNLRRNTRRSILSMSAIAIAAMAFVFLFGLIEGMKTDMKNNLHTYVTGEVRVRHSEFDKYQHLNPLHLGVPGYQEVTEEIESLEGTQAVSPRISFPTAVYREGETYNARGIGVDFSRETDYQDLEQYVVEGSIPEPGSDQVLVSHEMAEEIGLALGDKFTLLTQTRGRGMNAITFYVSGFTYYNLSSMDGNLFQAPLERVQYFLRMDDSVTEILVKLEDGTELAPYVSSLNGYFSEAGMEEVEARSWRNIPSTYSFITLAENIYHIIALLFFILGSTVIITTMMMTVYERRKEIGTVAAMGMTGPEIIRLFFLEAFYLSVIGSAVGVLVGIGITYPSSIYGLDFGGAMEGIDFDITTTIYPVLNLKSTIFVFVYSTLVASLTSLIPSRQSSKVEPIKALRTI
jgi:putative ABC transport system permease protein